LAPQLTVGSFSER